MNNDDNYTEDIEIKNRFRVLDKLKITNESIKSANISECSLCNLVDDFKIFKQNLINKFIDSNADSLISVFKISRNKTLFIEISNSASNNNYIFNTYVIDKKSHIITQKISLDEANAILQYETRAINRLRKLNKEFIHEKSLIDLNEYLKDFFNNNYSTRAPPEEYEDYTIDNDFDIER